MSNKNLNNYLEDMTKNYKQEKYSMSIRELLSMFSENAINLSPVYQRVFRWDNILASKLIESILLGIPLPPIFVSVRNGKWDIVDGVQRISSILWFCGKLNTDDKKGFLKLTGLDILEELNGYDYQQLKEVSYASLFKLFDYRRIDVNLLTSEDTDSEYELFSRLNTAGLTLSSQEIRNFLIAKLDINLYNDLRKFSSIKLTNSVLTVSKKQIEEDYKMELLVYLLIIINSEIKLNSINKYAYELYEEMAKKYLLSRPKFIDASINEILKSTNSIKKIEEIEKIFNTINKDIPNKPFADGRKFSPFLYICLVSFIYYHPNNKIDLNEIVKKIKNSNSFTSKANRGANVVKQFLTGIKIGKDLI